jgi:hypothetical protein
MSVFDPNYIARVLLFVFVLAVLGTGLAFIWVSGQTAAQPYPSRQNRRSINRRTTLTGQP